MNVLVTTNTQHALAFYDVPRMLNQ
jgi:hypothetical protein